MDSSKQNKSNSSYIHAVITAANKKGYNWFPLVEYIVNGDPIEIVAEMLLEAHFELSEYIAADEEAPGRSEIENALYILRKMYQLFQELNPQKREIPIYLYMGESKEMGVNTLLPPPMTDPSSNTTDAEWVLIDDSKKKPKKNAVAIYGKKANA